MTRLFCVDGSRLQRQNFGLSHLCRFNVSSLHQCLFQRRHGGTGRCKRRLLLPYGCSDDHWALDTALTPFWRCGESDQRDVLLLTPMPIHQPSRRTTRCPHPPGQSADDAPRGFWQMQQALGDGLEEICWPLSNQANYRINIR